MRLVTFIRRNIAREETSIPRMGALIGDGAQVLDFFTALNISEKEFRLSAALLEWFDLNGTLLPQAVALYTKFISGESNSEFLKEAVLSRDEVRLLPPVMRPGKLICIGLNYLDHVIESKMPIPERPVVFSKFVTSIIGPEQNIILPAGSEKSDYEAELAVIIGRHGKNINQEDAFDYVLGYTNLNDISERGYQFADGQWQRGKSCDTFAPIGPFIATKDEIANPHTLQVKLRLNGETLQDSNTNQLIFDIPTLISFLSETVTLEPGDIIATGTPPGVGFARNPPIFLKSEDIIEVEIEGLGILSNPVA